MPTRRGRLRSRHRAHSSPAERSAHLIGSLLPVGVLSVAWTVSLVTSSLSAVPVADSTDPVEPSPEVSVPSRTVEEPANYTVPGTVRKDLRPAQSRQMVRVATARDIPAAALSAYQRAATVMSASHDSCALPWQLVAAIGRVESDHGRFGDNRLDSQGVARPGIFGPALDGTHGTREIADTDAGQYDRDAVHDRAVGPMQIIPMTWSTIGVDADGDGSRDPQDIDDAALAAGVYLCSGDADLSTVAGQRAAVHRYNNSWEYVDLVLSLAATYADSPAMPTTVAASATIPRLVGPQTGGTPARESGPTGEAVAAPAPSAGSPTKETKSPSQPKAPTTSDAPPAPTKQETDNPVKTLIEDSQVGTLLTEAQARAQCLGSGLLALDLKAVQRCVDALLVP